MTDSEIREKLRKKVKFRKDANEMWHATLVMADGFHYGYSHPGPAKTAKPHAREGVIDMAMNGDHPLPVRK